MPGEGPPPPVKAIVNTLPFSTKEPERYQAEIVISFPEGGRDAEQQYFTARDGERRRIDYPLPYGKTLVLLEGPDGKTIVLLPQKKCSVENKNPSAGAAAPPGEAFGEFLTTGWLAEKIPAGFEDLGKEETGGKLLAKFRVRFEKNGGAESTSEAIVWVDEEIGMPVKTEFYSPADGRPLNKVTTEFRNLKLDVEPGIFDIAAGCQNISAAEMQKILRQERLP